MELTRRTFLKGASLTVGAAAIAGLASCSSPKEASDAASDGASAEAIQVSETKECDICVVGGGISGLAAAVQAAESGARVICIDPNCETNKEPDVVVGECPVCKAAGKQAKLIAQKNPRTLKRFIRCENHDECGVGYPLPQYGKLTATDEVCEHCGAPLVIVTTARGPWKLCPNFDCPGKEQDDSEKAASKGKKSAAKKSAAAKFQPTLPARGATRVCACAGAR